MSDIYDLVEPTNNAMTVVRDQSAEKAGEIYLPEQSKKPCATGRVVRCSDDCNMKLPRDTRVHFDQFAEHSIEVGGVEVILLKAEDVLCVINSDAPVTEGGKK